MGGGGADSMGLDIDHSRFGPCFRRLLSTGCRDLQEVATVVRGSCRGTGTRNRRRAHRARTCDPRPPHFECSASGRFRLSGSPATHSIYSARGLSFQINMVLTGFGSFDTIIVSSSRSISVFRILQAALVSEKSKDYHGGDVLPKGRRVKFLQPITELSTKYREYNRKLYFGGFVLYEKAR